MIEALEKLHKLSAAIDGVAHALDDVDRNIALEALTIVAARIQTSNDPEPVVSESKPRRRAKAKAKAKAKLQPKRRKRTAEKTSRRPSSKPSVSKPIAKPKKKTPSIISSGFGSGRKQDANLIDKVVEWVATHEGTAKSSAIEHAMKTGHEITRVRPRFSKAKEQGRIERDPDVREGWRLTNKERHDRIKLLASSTNEHA